MPHRQLLYSLLHDLDSSLHRLEASDISALAEVLRPIVLRRRRAASALRMALRMQNSPPPLLRTVSHNTQPVTLTAICDDERRLLLRYDATLGEGHFDDKVADLLREQRAETEQAYLTLWTRLRDERSTP